MLIVFNTDVIHHFNYVEASPQPYLSPKEFSHPHPLLQLVLLFYSKETVLQSIVCLSVSLPDNKLLEGPHCLYSAWSIVLLKKFLLNLTDNSKGKKLKIQQKNPKRVRIPLMVMVSGSILSSPSLSRGEANKFSTVSSGLPSPSIRQQGQEHFPSKKEIMITVIVFKYLKESDPQLLWELPYFGKKLL